MRLALLAVGFAVGCGGATTSGAGLRDEDAIAETLEERFPSECVTTSGPTVHVYPPHDTIVVHVTVAPNGALTMRDLSNCASEIISFECVRDHFARKHIRGVADHTLDADLVFTNEIQLGDFFRPRVLTRKRYEKAFGKAATRTHICRATW